MILLGNDGTQVEKLVKDAGALVRAFYPATHGARALASLLFGKENRWGKLPVTMYPKDYLSQLPAMGEHTGSAYAMDHGPGRSYRYYKGVPTYKFGQGLSLTTFKFACKPCPSADDVGSDANDLCARCAGKQLRKSTYVAQVCTHPAKRLLIICLLARRSPFPQCILLLTFPPTSPLSLPRGRSDKHGQCHWRRSGPGLPHRWSRRPRSRFQAPSCPDQAACRV